MPLGIEIDTAMMLTNDEVDMILTDDQMDVLNQAMWGAFNDLNAHTKVLDLREAHANEIKKGGEALQAVKVTLHDEMEKTSEAMNAANAFVTFPETPHSPVVVEENEDWAGVFFEEHEAPIAEHQDSFTEYEASSTVQTVSASDQTSSPTDQTASFSKRNGLEHFDDGMPTYEDVENAAKELLTYEDFEGEPKGLNELYGEILDFDELYPQPKGPIGLLESPLSSPSISSSADVQNSVQQFVQPVHQAKQPLHQVEEKVHQVKTPHQAEQTIHQVQPTHQAQPLHAEEQTVRPIDAAHQVKEPVIHVEQPVHQMQPACSIKLPTGQLHLPMHQPQGAYQIHQPSLYLPQNHPQLKQVTKKAQDMAKKSAVASTTVTKSAPTTLLVDAQLVRASHVPQMVVAGLQDCGEPEMMDGVLAHESNERSYIVTEEQSEYGLAGLFGLTLDQVKSGMRNKKVRVRNTIIEKPKPATTCSLLQYAGVQKSKSAKVKLAASPVHIQTQPEKTRPDPTVPLAGPQLSDKPHGPTPVKTKLPPYITEENFLEVKKMVQDEAQQFYLQRLGEEVRKAQQLACQSALYHQQPLQQRAYQAAVRPSDLQALHTSSEQAPQLNPFHRQQQAPQTAQYQHAHQTAHYASQQHAEQSVDYISSMPGNHRGLNNLTQQVAQMTPCQSPMQGNQALSYSTSQIAYMAPYYSPMPRTQAAFYPSPQVTQMPHSHSPQQARQVPSCISPITASQVVSYQSLPAHQMAAFNLPQQAPQIGAYPSTQQTWQFAQQGPQPQQQVYYPQPQKSQQPDRYYNPLPAQQPIGYVPPYDPQNQAQIVAQQHRIQQDQIQRQQTQESGLPFQQTLEDNIRNSDTMVAQANAGNPKRLKWSVDDFFKQHH